MNKSESINELATALAKAQAVYPEIVKDKLVTVKMKSGGTYCYKFAEFSSIVAAVKKPLADNGISFHQELIDTEKGLTCLTTVMHSSGQWITSSMPVVPKETDMQGIAGAYTFSRRYGLSAAIGVVTEEDTDGNGENREQYPAAAKAKPAATKAMKQSPPKEMSALDRMNLGSWVLPGGKYVGKRLGEIPQEEAMSYRDEMLRSFGSTEAMPKVAAEIFENLSAYYSELI